MHMNISVSPFSLPLFRIATASVTTAMFLIRQQVPSSVAGLGILAFSSLFNHSSEEALSLISTSKTPTR